jgi:hypothetical protein
MLIKKHTVSIRIVGLDSRTASIECTLNKPDMSIKMHAPKVGIESSIAAKQSIHRPLDITLRVPARSPLPIVSATAFIIPLLIPKSAKLIIAMPELMAIHIP